MKRSWNPGIWGGFVLVLVGIVSFPLFFARFAATRDVPWASLLIIAVALLLLGTGIGRAFRQKERYRGKVSGSILGVLAVLTTGFFLLEIFYIARELPASHGAPQVGQMAPDFTLPDSHNNAVTLSALVNSPFEPNGPQATSTPSGQTAATILIFYRGYW